VSLHDRGNEADLACGGQARARGPGVPDAPPNHLVLEWIDEGHRRADTERELGVALAQLHQAGASCFGREDRRTTGSRGLPNEPRATWAEFYATNRLLPLARLARDAHALPTDAIVELERLAGDLERFDAAGEPPARLHGDLWAGNLLWTGDRVWLIDPAAHGGHRETDLAQLALFGGAPYLDQILAAYDEAAPLADGWQARVPLHQLHLLLVHAAMFGPTWMPPSTIDRYA
jgi:fructosamine-3-kinase